MFPSAESTRVVSPLIAVELAATPVVGSSTVFWRAVICPATVLNSSSFEVIRVLKVSMALTVAENSPPSDSTDCSSVISVA